MKRKYIYGNSYALIVCIGVLFIFASCVSEEITKKSDARETNLTAFVAGNPESRTSLDYNSSDFFWGAGDKIYVQDDDGVWQESNNSPSGRTASFRFNVPGNFTNSILIRCIILVVMEVMIKLQSQMFKLKQLLIIQLI